MVFFMILLSNWTQRRQKDMNTKKSNNKPENRNSTGEKNQDENITKQTEEMDSWHYCYCGLFNLTKYLLKGQFSQKYISLGCNVLTPLIDLKVWKHLWSIGNIVDSPTRRVGESFFDYEYLREFEVKIGTARNVVPIYAKIPENPPRCHVPLI